VVYTVVVRCSIEVRQFGYCRLFRPMRCTRYGIGPHLHLHLHPRGCPLLQLSSDRPIPISALSLCESSPRPAPLISCISFRLLGVPDVGGTETAAPLRCCPALAAPFSMSAWCDTRYDKAIASHSACEYPMHPAVSLEHTLPYCTQPLDA